MNNVRHLRPAELPRQPVEPKPEPEPTELQRAVLARARELRERENQPRTRSPVQWVAAAVLAVACFGVMYGAVDVVLRKMQHLTEGFAARSSAAAPVAAEPEPEVLPQSQTPTDPYFIQVQPQSTQTR